MADEIDKEAAMNVTLQEMEDILKTYEMIESKDTEIDHGISRKDPDVELITEEFAGVDKHNCESMTDENRVTSSELQNLEPEALNSELQNPTLTGKGNGTVLAVVDEIGSEEFLNPMKGENVAGRVIRNEEKNQTSNSEEVTHASAGSEAVELTDTEGNPNAGQDDQNSASGFQRDATTSGGRKAAEVNTENVGSETPKSETDSTDNGVEVMADTREATAVKVDQEPNLDSQDDTVGDNPQRMTEGKTGNGTVEKADTKSVGNQTTPSLILAVTETKGIQTEGEMFESEDSRKRFQDKELKPKNEIRGQGNHNEMQQPARELGVPNGCEMQTNQLEESTETIRNALPRPTEETVTQCTAWGVLGILEKPKGDFWDNSRSSQDNCPEVEIAKEVTVDSISETQPKTCEATVTGTAAVQSDNDNSVVGKPLKKRLTREEIEETLRILRLGNSCTDPQERRNAKEIYAKQAGEPEGGSSLPLVKPPFDYRAAFLEDKRHEGPSARSKLRTLEDCLNAFDLFPLLLKLEESLEKVRRGKRTTTEHEADCKSFDKELVRLSREHHPDSVMRRCGSEEEVKRAKELQTALNAVRTVLNTLNKIFLEDIDIEHRYQFFTRLDIGMLGNEDQVEDHAYQVLFKISLVSEIKQESIVAEVRRFLEAAHLCVDSYVRNSVPDFEKHRDSVFFYLRRCVSGYQKLHSELSDVTTECREEKLRNIFPLIQRMKLDCQKQLQHLEGLLQLTQHPFWENVPIYSNRMDDHFVRPLDCYVSVIMACSVMIKKDENKGAFKRFKDGAASACRNPSPSYRLNQFSNRDASAGRDDAISLLCKLASFYAGDKQYRTFVEELLHKEYATKEDAKGQFLVRLTEVVADLKEEFKPEDYVAKGTKNYILKELKFCREMKEEFEAEKNKVVKGLKEINKNYESIAERMDKLLRDQERYSRELSEQLSDAKVNKEKIEKYSRKKPAN